MKKIIFLSIGLLFSSAQAIDLKQADIAQAAAELVKNSEFVIRVCAMHQQGLTVEQIAEELVLSSKIRVQEISDCRFEPMDTHPSLLGFFLFPIVLMAVGYVGLVISSCCEELLKEEKNVKE